MAFILALLVGIAVIAGIVAYWVMMAALFIFGVICVLWFIVFAMFINDPYVAALCAIAAAFATLWLSDKRKKNEA